MVEPPDDVTDIVTRIAPRDPWIGLLVAGRYRLVRHIAGGSFGEVYEARQRLLEKSEKTVAIKLLKPEIATDEGSVLRFEDEVRAVARLAHPNICNVTDAGRHESTYFLAMDYAEGGSLLEQLDAARTARRKLDPTLVTRWLREACEGLLAAERNTLPDGSPDPIFHRDVKPANLLLKDGRVLVADFGAARLGRADEPRTTSPLAPALWTPAYGSPEQRGGDGDHRTDMYALGVSFYQLLTGELPQHRFTEKSDRFTEAHDPRLVEPSVPARLAAIVTRMTQPRVADRYPSFADAIEALRALEVRPVPRWIRWLAIAGVLLVVGVGVAIGTGVIRFEPPYRADPNAETIADVDSRYQGLRNDVTSALGRTDWSRLATFERDWRALGSDLDRRIGVLAEIRAAEGAEARLDLSDSELGRDDLAQLDIRRDGLEQRTAGANRVLEGVDLIYRELATRPIQDLRSEQLGLLGDARSLGAPELVSACGDAAAEIRRVESAREERVQSVRTGLERDELVGIDSLIGEHRVALSACREEGLVRQLDELQELVTAARHRAAELPVWPGDRVGVDALEALAEASAAFVRDVPPDGLKSWLRTRARNVGARWIVTARDWLDAAVRATTDEIRAVNEQCASRSIARDRYRSAADSRERLLGALRGLVNAAAVDENPLAHDSEFRAALQRTVREIPELARFPSEDLGTMAGWSSLATQAREEALRIDGMRSDLRALAPGFRALADRSDRLAAEPGGEGSAAAIDDARAELERMRRLLNAADANASRLDGVAAEIPTKSVAELRLDLPMLAAEIEQLCPELSARSEELRRRLSAELHRRQSAVVMLERRLRSGDDPAAVAYAAGRLRAAMTARHEDTFASECRELIGGALVAEDLLRAAAWTRTEAANSPWQQLDLFRAVVEARAETRVPNASEVRDWWTAFNRRSLCSASVTAAAQLRGLHDSLAAAIAAGARASGDDLHEKHRRFEALRADLNASYRRRPEWFPDEFRDALRLALGTPTATGDASTEPVPEGWPADLSAPKSIRSTVLADEPQFRRRYSPQFIRDHAGTLRLWYFEGRVEWVEGDSPAGGELVPVYMVIVRRGDLDLLVDVSEVTMGELKRHCGYFPPDDDPRGVIQRGDAAAGRYFRYDVAERRSFGGSDYLAFRTRLTVAQEFAKELQAVCPGIRPPTPGEWEMLERSAPAHEAGRRSDPVRIGDDLEDVTPDGVRGLRSGLREWVDDQDPRSGASPRGATSYSPTNPPNGQWVMNAGFRLVMPLRRL